MKLAVALFSIMLVGCAPATPTQDVKLLEPHERIGYLVELSNSPTHRHAGGNPLIRDYDRPYPFDWKVTQRTAELLDRRLREAQFLFPPQRIAG